MRAMFPVVLAFIFCTYFNTAHAMGDPIAGKSKAALCEGCHGERSSNPLAPKLAGQRQRYIVKQIINFRDGVRKDPIMSGMAATLSNEQDIEDIATYYASLPYQKINRDKLTTASDMGQRLYEQKCIMCHGELGNGRKSNNADPLFGSRQLQNDSNTPLIGGQPQPYLVKTLKEFRAKQRSSGADYMMDMVLQFMSDDQITLVTNYLSSLSGGITKSESLVKND